MIVRQAFGSKLRGPMNFSAWVPSKSSNEGEYVVFPPPGFAFGPKVFPEISVNTVFAPESGVPVTTTFRPSLIALRATSAQKIKLAQDSRAKRPFL